MKNNVKKIMMLMITAICLSGTMLQSMLDEGPDFSAYEHSYAQSNYDDLFYGCLINELKRRNVFTSIGNNQWCFNVQIFKSLFDEGQDNFSSLFNQWKVGCTRDARSGVHEKLYKKLKKFVLYVLAGWNNDILTARWDDFTNKIILLLTTIQMPQVRIQEECDKFMYVKTFYRVPMADSRVVNSNEAQAAILSCLNGEVRAREAVVQRVARRAAAQAGKLSPYLTVGYAYARQGYKLYQIWQVCTAACGGPVGMCTISACKAAELTIGQVADIVIMPAVAGLVVKKVADKFIVRNEEVA